MITEYIRYRIASDDAAEFEAAWGRAGASLASAPECVGYDLARLADEASPDLTYVTRIIWTSADAHLDGFRAGKNFPPFFAEIQPYADHIEEMRHYEQTEVRGQGGSVPSIWEWAGGDEALNRLTEIFYHRHVLSDELIGPLFAHMDHDHPKYVAMWLSEVFGGPARYTAERGGYQHMIARHLGKAITEPQRRRWVALLMDAADEAGLPDDPEFRAAFTGYIEWGTRIARANSQPGANPPRQAPVPHWGWGVAPP